jgi:penicillin-binding protein 1C
VNLRRRLRRAALAVALLALAPLGAERLFDLCCPYPLATLAGLPRSPVVTAAEGTQLQVWPTPAGERVLATRWVELPAHLRDAILTAEDADFFAHGGVDVGAVLRAAWQNLAAGRVVSGASTLTMQAVRIVEPRPRTFAAKLVEAFRARQLERALGKEAIADLWVTQVPMGGTLRGFGAAAWHWFGKRVEELDLAEAAMLVAMVPAPSARAPHRAPELLRARRDALLDAMVRSGKADAAAAARARAAPLGAARHAWPQHAWHLAAFELAEAPGTDTVATAADPALQRRLEALVRERADLPGDGAAVVVLDRASGRLRALVAGREGTAGNLDLARRRRSLGSTLKPFLFALARERGILSEGRSLDDSPLEIGGWRPANYDRGHAGRIRPADALAASANLPAVRCLHELGVGPFRDLLVRLGLPAPDAIGLDAALGTMAASPVELARAYQRFVAGRAELGIGPAAVDWTLAAMSRLPLGAQLPGRVAWKSGTSSGNRDAWCVGITGREVMVVWLGNRSGRGETDLNGVRTAAALLGELVGLL